VATTSQTGSHVHVQVANRATVSTTATHSITFCSSSRISAAASAAVADRAGTTTTGRSSTAVIGPPP
jgi:hypothetical protein